MYEKLKLIFSYCFFISYCGFINSSTPGQNILNSVIWLYFYFIEIRYWHFEIPQTNLNKNFDIKFLKYFWVFKNVNNLILVQSLPITLSENRYLTISNIILLSIPTKMSKDWWKHLEMFPSPSPVPFPGHHVVSMELAGFDPITMGNWILSIWRSGVSFFFCLSW